MMDTNICVFLTKHIPSVVKSYEEEKSKGVAISSISVAEMYYGACKSERQTETTINLNRFLSGASILDFDTLAAIEYGNIRAFLQKQGTPIGPLDMLIAAHAKAVGLTLVTNSTREFSRVPGLVVEDWLR
ncbi:MAG: type II toxin-antitoxin system VapC family toxin [Clostridia bacterium]|nr:type II toxin-antitoxin system VapC family toxin [Clostridia bacterium]